MTITHRRSGDHRHLPLHGIRVLECGDTLAAAYAGRLFVELGADVVKVELLGGDPLRRVGPFAFPPVVDADPGANAGAAAGPSVSFAYYHAGKRSVAVDHAAVASATLLGDLARRADVVIRCTASGDDWIDDEALHDAQLANPGLVVVDISTYGRQSGDASMSDLLALAASGLLLLNVDSDGNPLRYRGELASVHAAADAVLAAISALLGRLGDGAGQRIDISAQAATAAILTAIAIYTYTGDLPQFGGLPAIAPWGFFECADGTALIMVNEDAQWVGLRRVLGEPEWAAIELFDTNAVRRENFELVNALVAEALKERGLDELLAACTRDGVPASKVHTAADVVAWPHLHERGYLAPLDVGTGDQPHTVLAPGSPWRFARTTVPPISRRAPRLGEHTSTAVQDWETATDTPEARSIGAAAAAPAAPLAGRRVVDMTWVWAGPYAAMQFAHLGADVVKAESDRRIDVTRILNPFADDVRGVNRSGYFNMYSQGKRSITVDVTQPDGLALLKRIIAGSDLIMDNMRPGAMVRLGLGPDVLEALEPALVAVAMSGFGETGPERDQMAYGAVIDALCGVSASNGPPGVGPTFFPMSMPDPCAGIHASIAAAAAIYRAQRTGRGDRVEISMTEATIAAFPWPVLIESAGAGPVVNVGNRDDTMCPHGTFACAGTRQWLAVVSRDDADFAALASVIGRPELATDARFATFAARKQHEDEVEAAVSAWTSTRSRAEAAAELTAAGVACAELLDVAEVMVSEHLVERDFMLRHEHPEVGTRPLPGPAWTTPRSPLRAPLRAASAAPCLGQHTDEVLTGLLGLTPAEIDALRARNLLH